MVTVKMIVKLDVTVPIQLWHLRGDIDNSTRVDPKSFQSKLNTVQFEDFVQAAKLSEIYHNPELKLAILKALALNYGNFENILLLDHNVVPTCSIQYLFSHPLYVEHGLILWSDVYRPHQDNPIWTILGSQIKSRCVIDMQLREIRNVSRLVDNTSLLSRSVMVDDDENLFYDDLVLGQSRLSLFKMSSKTQSNIMIIFS